MEVDVVNEGYEELNEVADFNTSEWYGRKIVLEQNDRIKFAVYHSENEKIILARKVDARFEGKVTWKWGGSDGTSFSGSANSEVYDKNGNFINGEMEYDNKSGGSASLSAGCDSRNKKK